MTLKSRPPVVFYCKRSAIILCVAGLITSCANGPNAKSLEESLAADSRLLSNSPTLGVNSPQTPQPTPTTETANLPADFPADLPIYPGAKLQEVRDTENGAVKVIRWESVDPSNAIASFYQRELKAKNWQVVQAPVSGTETNFQVSRNQQQVKISIQPQTVSNRAPNQPQTATMLTVEYAPGNRPLTGATPPSTLPPLVAAPKNPPNQSQQPLIFINDRQQYSDIGNIPQPTRGYIEDLAALGVIPVREDNNKTNQSDTFQPNKTISRGEYARWLIAANNALHGNKPSQQIRLADTSKQPAFKDVPNTHPDFPAIQGLAEAGLIPSPLSGNTNEVLFRPDAPLTRETMLLWKIPLDVRQALSNGNVNTIKETWGFQDAGKITPSALGAVLADYQNGDKSNIRRVLGYTTIFQPKKSVTRSEAAATLWYFGSQNEGISAQEAIKLKE